jgi:hypothetical protein
VDEFEVFQNGAAFSICFYGCPLFLLQGLQIPSRIGALLDCQGGDEYSSADA